MRWLWIVAALVLALVARADAQTLQTFQSGRSGMGQGIICDTPEQAGRFLALRNGGADTDHAVQTVNAEARDERACGAAMVAFTRDKDGAKASLQRLDGKPVEIVKIRVIAISQDGATWAPIAPKIQYTVVPAQGLDI